METKIDMRRIVLFLSLAFGIAWLTGLVIYLTGGLANSPQVGPGITLALILLAVPYMWAPALANILTRLLTREGWKDVGLRPRFRQGWPYWLMGWVLPALMTVAGAAAFFLLFPGYFDPTLSRVQQSTLSSPALAQLSPWAVVGLQLLLGIAISPIANSLATFGEEFGWRAYLLPRLLPLGWRKAMLIMGAVWGVWHWPVIFMGYEYGFNYPGHPWVGPLLFLWVTFCFGTFLAWLTLRAGSVWPAVIGHAAINGIAALAVLGTIGTPNPLLGPLPVGIIGSLGYAVVALALFFSPGQKVIRLVAQSHESQTNSLNIEG
ncbi:MAG: CPBP family intramembrane metalloprotease [Chloroflexi bacterium]|nr:CPBP family intramembrane metalloprotease [Chloroflexota bacterium]